MSGFLKCVCVGDLAVTLHLFTRCKRAFSHLSHDSARPGKQPNVIAMNHLHKSHQIQWTHFFFLYPIQHFLKKIIQSHSYSKSLGLKNLNSQPLNTGPAKQPHPCQEGAEPPCRPMSLQMSVSFGP